MTNDTLKYMSVKEMASLIATKKLSPVEVMEATIERIERQNPHLNAFVYTDVEQARQKARLVEEKVMQDEQLSPLHGIPTAIKDLFNCNYGWVRTLGGIRAFKNNVVHFSDIFG